MSEEDRDFASTSFHSVLTFAKNEASFEFNSARIAYWTGWLLRAPKVQNRRSTWTEISAQSLMDERLDADGMTRDRE
jgi:hypothetical protein